MASREQRRGIPVDKINQHVLQHGPVQAHVCPICRDTFPVIAAEDVMEEATMEHLQDHTLDDVLGYLAGQIAIVREVVPKMGGSLA